MDSDGLATDPETKVVANAPGAVAPTVFKKVRRFIIGSSSFDSQKFGLRPALGPSRFFQSKGLEPIRWESSHIAFNPFLTQGVIESLPLMNHTGFTDNPES